MADGFSLGALLGSLSGLAPAQSGQGAEGVAGAGGLFNALLTQDAATAPSDTSAAPDLTALLMGALTAGSAPVVQQPSGLPVQVEGEAAAVQVLSQQISILYQQITIQGGFTFGAKGEAGDLAAALTKLGLPADEAQALAAKIDTMLELIRQQAMLEKEKLSMETGGSLVAVLLASLLNGQQLQTLQVPQTQVSAVSITQVQVQILQTQITINTGSWQAVQARAQSVPGASTLLQGTEVAPIQVKPQAAPAAPQVVANVQTLLPEDLAELVTQPAPLPTVAIALPTDVPPQPQASLVPQTPLPTVQPVAAPKPLQGTVLYRLTETQPGAPVLQALAVPPIAESQAVSAEAADTAALDLELTAAPDLTTTLTATPVLFTEGKPTQAPAASVLERLYQASQAQVGQQLQIAIQPLVHNGKGGAVQLVLNPPELGRIEVHLKIDNGQISGTVSAQDAGVVEHLARELPALRQSFLEAGLKIADQGLSLMLSNQNNPDQQQPQNPFAALNDERTTNRRGGEADSGTASATTSIETAATAARWVSPNQLVDVAA